MKTMVGNLETGHMVSEVFSPPRVVTMARELGFAGGWSLDMTTVDDEGQPWDFNKPEMRDKERKLVRDTKPTLLKGGPMYREWSILQNLSKARRDPMEWKKKVAEARIHLEFVIELCATQSNQGRCWMHERPKSARSWGEKNMISLPAKEDSMSVEGRMCRFGMTSEDAEGVGAVLKPEFIATNCRGIADSLDEKCASRGNVTDRRHVPLMNGRGKSAGIYPPPYASPYAKD
jgi:hypothetical protein